MFLVFYNDFYEAIEDAETESRTSQTRVATQQPSVSALPVLARHFACAGASAYFGVSGPPFPRAL
ncbi:MAG TPA: hypothetical protein VLK85_09675 [Ramlibacter sp.]|nr:hypothetical protein [Ramlibacter sp.]